MFTVISEVSALTNRRTLPQCILSFSFPLQMGSMTVLDLIVMFHNSSTFHRVGRSSNPMMKGGEGQETGCKTQNHFTEKEKQSFMGVIDPEQMGRSDRMQGQ